MLYCVRCGDPIDKNELVCDKCGLRFTLVNEKGATVYINQTPNPVSGSRNLPPHLVVRTTRRYTTNGSTRSTNTKTTKCSPNWATRSTNAKTAKCTASRTARSTNVKTAKCTASRTARSTTIKNANCTASRTTRSTTSDSRITKEANGSC